MNNYEYITAGLPAISKDNSANGSIDADAIIGEIRSLLGEKDNRALDFFLKGFSPENLNEDFYKEALASGIRFIREYFRLDLNVRNTRTAYLNRELGREEGQDLIPLETGEFDGEQELEAVLRGKDILERERGIDDFYWKETDNLVCLEVFSLDLILAFIAKLKIVDRWMKLDPETGRELFRKFTEEIRNER